MTMKAGYPLQASKAQGHATYNTCAQAQLPCPAGWPRAEVSWQLSTPSCPLSQEGGSLPSKGLIGAACNC